VDIDLNEYAKTQYVDQIADRQDRELTGLENRMVEDEVEIASNSNKIVELAGKHNLEMSELRGEQLADKNYLEALISRLESRHNNLITKHDNELANLKSNTNATKADVTAMDGRVTQNTADIGGLITQLGNVEAALDGILAIQEEMICIPFTLYCESIDNTFELKTQRGMTWAMWCNSSYNTIGAEALDAIVVWSENGGKAHMIYHTYDYTIDDYQNVKPDDVIEEGHRYVCKWGG
jgi:hypothetical protein